MYNTYMKKKLTITVEDDIYDGLHSVIGPRKISSFIQELVRPHVIKRELESQYFEMSMNKLREKDALEWSEALLDDHNEQR